MFSESNTFYMIYKTLSGILNAFHFVNVRSEAELYVPEETVSQTLLDSTLFCFSVMDSILDQGEIQTLNSFSVYALSQFLLYNSPQSN